MRIVPFRRRPDRVRAPLPALRLSSRFYPEPVVRARRNARVPAFHGQATAPQRSGSSAILRVLVAGPKGSWPAGSAWSAESSTRQYFFPADILLTLWSVPEFNVHRGLLRGDRDPEPTGRTKSGHVSQVSAGSLPQVGVVVDRFRQSSPRKASSRMPVQAPAIPRRSLRTTPCPGSFPSKWSPVGIRLQRTGPASRQPGANGC